jgi:hypothetical protein
VVRGAGLVCPSGADLFHEDGDAGGSATVNQILRPCRIRYELVSPYIETQNRMADLILDPGSPVYGQFILAGNSRLPRSLLSWDKNNFAPRVGFAWRVSESRGLRSARIIRHFLCAGYGQRRIGPHHQ